ncbi:hypothetical protein RRG08_028267 [Elysia crispata]|uniref:Uncharacterized protein n=1 Tax=Elysia crispata TaxID=231223 RepID=A0AAE1DI68_9GAST|nr:hypothetical protein RRG08_028267 [Elysia crispata]
MSYIRIFHFIYQHFSVDRTLQSGHNPVGQGRVGKIGFITVSQYDMTGTTLLSQIPYSNLCNSMNWAFVVYRMKQFFVRDTSHIFYSIWLIKILMQSGPRAIEIYENFCREVFRTQELRRRSQSEVMEGNEKWILSEKISLNRKFDTLER